MKLERIKAAPADPIWFEHDGLTVPKFARGTMVIVRFANGMTMDRPSSAAFWGEHWLKCAQPGRYINGYQIAAPVVNLSSRVDALRERRTGL